MPDSNAILNEAYELIEQGQHARARELLEPLLTSDPNNPDVWWVYAHAVEDEEEGQRALERVAELDPNYEGLEALQTEVQGQTQPTEPPRWICPNKNLTARANP